MLGFSAGCDSSESPLGQQEALRTYTEFADGTHRGMFDPATEEKGYPDEDYDATTAMVINWHRMPEEDSELDSRLRYRQVHPSVSSWQTADGESFEFWYREERVNRVVLRGLQPGSVYEYKVREEGEVFRFRTMPSSLDERPLRIVMT
ncbi:MAG: fibronectin type III domain-containing protein, partial [Balneolaceae bacterium]|nr:fibronectin type III domain-containing protein [Balneolaceae bacterium]